MTTLLYQQTLEKSTMDKKRKAKLENEGGGKSKSLLAMFLINYILSIIPNR